MVQLWRIDGALVPQWLENFHTYPFDISRCIVPDPASNSIFSVIKLERIQHQLRRIEVSWAPDPCHSVSGLGLVAATCSTDFFTDTLCMMYLVFHIWQWWTELRGLKILISIDCDRKDVLRVDGDLQFYFKVFLNAWNDVESITPNLATALAKSGVELISCSTKSSFKQTV